MIVGRVKRIPSFWAPIFMAALLFYPSRTEAGCRDLELAGRFGAVAHAAEAGATIRYFGHNFFLITTSKGTRIVTDPLGPGWYPTPDVVGDVVTVGREHRNHNWVELVRGNPMVLRGLKGYGAEWNKVSMSYKDIFIYNVPIYQFAGSMGGIKGAAFVFDLGTLCIAHLGDLSQKLTPEQLKMIGKVDVALTPIGGRRTMGPEIAREVLKQLKPKIAIPMHFRDSLYRIQEFTAGIKTQYLNGDTLVVSKENLPPSLEIRVLLHQGVASYE